jgi:hypothetical protein
MSEATSIMLGLLVGTLLFWAGLTVVDWRERRQGQRRLDAPLPDDHLTGIEEQAMRGRFGVRMVR